jgi:hypothetical protein
VGGDAGVAGTIFKTNLGRVCEATGFVTSGAIGACIGVEMLLDG